MHLIRKCCANIILCRRPKKPKKKKQKVKEDAAAKISGPSNAEEAQLMRGVLGFASQPPAATPIALAPSSATAPPPQPQQQMVPAVSALPAPQQAQQPAQTQQAQQPAETQQAQAAPIQPQQQSTFTFGFAAERPAETAPVAGGSQASAAAPAAAGEAPQAAAQQALPGPPAAAAEPATDFVARRVFVGGMPFTYEVTHPPPYPLPRGPLLASYIQYLCSKCDPLSVRMPQGMHSL